MQADKKPEDDTVNIEARVWDRNALIASLKENNK